MITSNLRKITVEDVDDLYGLTLNIAFAIHIFDWKWFKRERDGMKYVLLDEIPDSDKILNKNFFHYIGDGRYVAKSLPKHDNRLKSMIALAEDLNDEQKRIYMRWLEDEIKSANHFDLAHANAEKRCRAHLKMKLEEKRKKECLVQSTEENS